MERLAKYEDLHKLENQKKSKKKIEKQIANENKIDLNESQ